jgi:hypothetical protein
MGVETPCDKVWVVDDSLEERDVRLAPFHHEFRECTP